MKYALAAEISAQLKVPRGGFSLWKWEFYPVHGDHVEMKLGECSTSRAWAIAIVATVPDVVNGEPVKAVRFFSADFDENMLLTVEYIDIAKRTISSITRNLVLHELDEGLYWGDKPLNDPHPVVT